MIVDIQPITHVGTVAVDRQRLALDRVQDDQWNELFGKLVRAVIVRTIRHDDWQAICLEPGMREMVGRRLAGRIRRTRSIGRLFTKQAGRAKRAIDFVGRDMDKAKPATSFGRQGGRSSFRAASSRLYVPTTLVLMKADGPVIERST